MTNLESKAYADGYTYTGHWFRRFETDRIAGQRAALKADGYLVRTIARANGISLFTKDTDKTLAIKAAKAAEAETRRIEYAKELRTYLASLDLGALPMHKLTSIKYAVEREIGQRV